MMGNQIFEKSQEFWLAMISEIVKNISMMTLFRFPYAVSFLLTIFSMLGVYFGYSYVAILLVLVFHPLIDTWIGSKTPHNPPLNPQFFDRFLVLTVAMVGVTWIFCLYHFVTAATMSDSLLIATACGLVMGFLGITTAHELVHRPEGLLKWLGFVTLWILNYGHWGIEHVYGHHKNVATENDPVSARKNENIYIYLVRAIGGSFIHSFEFEKKKNFFKSKVRLSLVIQFLINLALFAAFGVAGLIFHWIQSFIAVVLLEGVEYVEHYGLVRKKMANDLFEPVNEKHSWDCDFFLTNAALINLGYHSHHHQKPLVVFQDLPSKVGSRRLPLGYSMMILIAFFPPLYFQIMNPRLEQKVNATAVTA